jgi:transposase InsO family protein
MAKNDKHISSARRRAIYALKRDDITKCVACSLSKATKKHPRPIVRPTEWWTGDASGPFRRSFTGNKWFFQWADPAGWGYVGFGKAKSEATRDLRANKKIWERDYGAEITHLRTDRGGEYSSAAFKAWAASAGITLQFTAPDSSAGVAERKIRTVQERGRAFANYAAEQGGLPTNTYEYFWDEQIAYAQQVDWMLPSAVPRLNGTSPWQYRHHEPPPLDRLHPWGCKVVSHRPKSGKYQNRGRLAMFLGLARGGDDGYRLFDFATRSIYHSRSATFFDSLFFKEGERGVRRRAAGAASPGSIPGSMAKDDMSVVGVEDEPNKEEERLRSLLKHFEDQQQQHQPELQEEQRDQLDIPALVEEDDEIYADADYLPMAAAHAERGQRARTQREHFDPTLWAQQFSHDTERAHVAQRTIAILATRKVPRNHWEAMASEDSQLWTEAEREEKKSLRAKRVMRKVRRSKIPRGRRTITCKWAYDIKMKDGVIERYKARLVARGFLQRMGLDFSETFAPTPSLTSIRLIVALALKLGFKVHHQDVKTAFLIPPLPKEERVYIEPPPGFPSDSDFCYELMKCLYGLRQSAAKWNQHIDALLKSWNFEALHADACVYIHRTKSGKIDCIITCHVDDILIAAPDGVVDKVKARLSSKYEMKDLGVVSWYLGIKVTFGKGWVELSQRAFTRNILEEHRMLKANHRPTPAASGEAKTTAKLQPWQTTSNYRAVIGSLQYLTQTTRPDLAYSVGVASRQTACPTADSWLAVKHILAYLAGTADYGLRYVAQQDKRSASDITGWSDSDWAGSKCDRKSTSGFVFTYAGAAICWKSKKQSVVARSSAEAEIVALDLAVREALWLRKLKRALSIGHSKTIAIHEDNEAAIAISARNRRTARTKHIDVRYFAVSDDVANRRISVEPVASADNTADIFTKPLDRVKFTKFRDQLGVVPCVQEA